MKSIKLVAALTLAVLVSGCVVYPVGHRGGGYHGGHHHYHGGGHYRR